MPPKKNNSIAFEEAVTRLEEIVKQLEKGEVSLEKSLELYEEGCKLTKVCSSLLDKAQLKVKKYSTDTEEEKEFA